MTQEAHLLSFELEDSQLFRRRTDKEFLKSEDR